MANLISLISHCGKSPTAYWSTWLKRSILIQIVLHFLLAVEKYEMHKDGELVSKVCAGPK